MKHQSRLVEPASLFHSERGRFELPRGSTPLLAFQASAFDHSATSPQIARELLRAPYGQSLQGTPQKRNGQRPRLGGNGGNASERREQ